MTEPEAVLVPDASVVVALLTDNSALGDWLVQASSGRAFAGPALLPFEVSNVLRRLERSAHIAPSDAGQAHADLSQLPLMLLAYRDIASRVWELRGPLNAYDASYVAVAELLEVPLLTLDRKLARANGPRCQIVTPLR